MPDLTAEGVRAAGERLMQELGRALWQAHAGLAPPPALGALYARHRSAFGDEALAVARAEADADAAERARPSFPAASAAPEVPAASQDALPPAASDPPTPPTPPQRPPALLDWVVEQRVAAALAPLDERELAWERSAVVRHPGGARVAYGDVGRVLADTDDRAERLAWDTARARLVAGELAGWRAERLARERELVAALDLADGYVATFERLTRTDVRALATACEQLLADTQPMWDELLPTFARRRLGLGRAELAAVPLGRADVPALLRAREWDAALASGGMVATVRTQLAAMGVDATADGRVRADVGERPGKRARAFCAPVRIPDEVHLVVRPGGGVGDWRAFLHETGHALHLAHARRELPMEARWGGDHAVGEGHAMLLDQLVREPGWLVRYGGLARTPARELARSGAFEELYLLRRHAAKLHYELALHDGQVRTDALPELYVETLGAATGVRHRPEDALVDVDPRLYVVRYLRGWQLAAVLASTLRDGFDEDWWRNPRAGAWLATACWSAGQEESAEALAARVGATTLDFARVTRALEERLG